MNRKTGLILTMDTEEEIIPDENRKIMIIPVWKWMMEYFRL